MNPAIIDVVQELTDSLLEMHVRKTALQEAVKTHHSAGYDAVVTAAEAYFKFLNNG